MTPTPSQIKAHERRKSFHNHIAAVAATRHGERNSLMPTAAPPSAPIETRTRQEISVDHSNIGGSPLDPRFTFQNFMPGKSNLLAHAAARQISDALKSEPALFNPMYLHAGVGLGKTHLLQAIAWAGNVNAERSVLYLTADRFAYTFLAALRSQTYRNFKEALLALDVLIIDDLQCLQGKAVENEFCQILNIMLDAGRQVVVAADRAPFDLDRLDERLRSRLAGGLVVEAGVFNEDQRRSILESRIASARVYCPEFDVPSVVVNYLAQSVARSGRDLDGAVNRLMAYAKLSCGPVTLEIVEAQLHDLIRPPEPRRVKIEEIQKVVARHYDVARQDILSSRRTANVVRPRQVAMYLSKVLTLRSLPEIGRRFGGRDHTTVLHAVRKMEKLVGCDSLLADTVNILKKQLEDC